MDPLIIFVGVLLIVVALYIFSSRREGFSLGQRSYRLCPAVSERDEYLMPNSIQLVVQGYNYSLSPAVVRNEIEITPLQFAWDANHMTYYIVVYSPPHPNGNEWILKTSEDVKPVVTEGYSQRSMVVDKMGKGDGYTWWSLKY